MRFAVFYEHFYNFPQILVQLVKSFALRMGARKARNVPHKQAGLDTLFNNGSKVVRRAPYAAANAAFCQRVALKSSTASFIEDFSSSSIDFLSRMVLSTAG